jgi:uncharacterized protein (DUF1499 family)
MKILWRLVLLVSIVVVSLVMAGQVGLFSGTAPPLGVTNGRLKPPALTPNSVSSQAELYPDHPQRQYAAIAPLTYTGDADTAMARLVELLQKSKRTVVVAREPDYIYAQCTTALLKFTDDLEFWSDKQHQVIQVRSASRLGRGDFGVNRARVEDIRARFSP